MEQTFLEVQEKIALLKVRAEELRQSELKPLILDMKFKINIYGISAADLGFLDSVDIKETDRILNKNYETTKKEPKYIGPIEGEKWSGAGRPAKWTKDLPFGKELSDYLNPKWKKK
jgi:DNA-binding protein H-NS